MWYIKSRGSKFNYLKPLETIFQDLVRNKVVVEPFAGTYTVTHLFTRLGAKRVLASDIGLWSFVIGKALSTRGRTPRWTATTVSEFLRENVKNVGAKAVWVTWLLEARRVISPSIIQTEELDIPLFKQIWARFSDNYTPQIIPHRLSYKTFLQRRAPGKIVYIDTPKVFGEKTAFDYYGEIDRRLRDPLRNADRVWDTENVKKRHYELVKLIRKAKVVVWETYKKAEPSWEWVRELLRKQFPHFEEVAYKNDVIFVCSH